MVDIMTYYYLPRLEIGYPGFLLTSLLLLVASSRINKSPLRCSFAHEIVSILELNIFVNVDAQES